MEKELIKDNYVVVDKRDPVSKLIGKLKLNKEKAALVFDKKRFAGVADTHLLIRTKLDPSKLRVAKIIKKVPKLTGKEPIKETARLMFTAGTRLLPVFDKEMLVGVIKSKDLISLLDKTKYAKKKIKEVMSLKPITLMEDERIGKAISIMNENKISRLPLIDDKGELTNIISLTDLLFNFILRQQGRSETHGRGSLTQFGPRTIRAYKDRTDLDAYSVKNIASNTSSVVVTASPEDTVSRAIGKMERFDISSIVVVEDKKPVGIVTTRDLLRLFLEDLVTL